MRGAVIRVAVLASLALSCGGGPTAPPPPRFPDVNGAYSFLATFDGFASQQVNSSGSVTFQQVDPNAAPLIASANVAARFPGPKCSRCELDAHCDPVQHFACEGYVDGLSRCGDPTRPLHVPKRRRGARRPTVRGDIHQQRGDGRWRPDQFSPRQSVGSLAVRRHRLRGWSEHERHPHIRGRVEHADCRAMDGEPIARSIGHARGWAG